MLQFYFQEIVNITSTSVNTHIDITTINSKKRTILLIRFVTDCLKNFVGSVKVNRGRGGAEISMDLADPTNFRKQSVTNLISEDLKFDI